MFRLQAHIIKKFHLLQKILQMFNFGWVILQEQPFSSF